MRLSARVTAAVLATTAVAASLVIGIDGWPGAVGTLGSDYPDCEAFRTGLIRQPTTALTSLTFLPLGIWMAGDRRLRPPAARSLVGGAVILVGIGSFLAHAAGTDWARAFDSLAIKVMLVTFIVQAAARNWHNDRLLRSWAGAVGGVIVIQLAVPGTARPLLGVLVGASVAAAFASSGRRALPWLLAGLVGFGVGGLLWWLGRPGSSLCEPDAVFQLHGMWHILAAAGIASAYQVYRTEAL